MGLDRGPSHQGGKQRPFMTQQSQKQMRQEEWAVPSNHLENNLVPCFGVTGNLLQVESMGSVVWLSGARGPARSARSHPSAGSERALDSPATLGLTSALRLVGEPTRKFTARTPMRPRDP